MPGRDHPDAHRGQMEGADRPAPGHGGEGAAQAQGLCRSATESGVHPNRDRIQSEADPGRHVGLGHGL